MEYAGREPPVLSGNQYASDSKKTLCLSINRYKRTNRVYDGKALFSFYRPSSFSKRMANPLVGLAYCNLILLEAADRKTL